MRPYDAKKDFTVFYLHRLVVKTRRRIDRNKGIREGEKQIKNGKKRLAKKENGPSKWLLMSGARLPAPSGQKIK